MLTVVQSFQNEFDAQNAAALLQANGIEAYINDNHTVNMNWGLSNAIGGVKLSVRTDDAERAVEVLVRARRAEQLERTRCPRCKSIDTVNKGRGFLFGVLIPWMPHPLGRESGGYLCKNCDNYWVPEEQE